MPIYPTNPPLDCDVVMKGGITSGVIYPGAVCELATTYRLRSVGGASAGAIAAAAAAAAEYGRASGGFDKLARLPHDITAPSAAGGSTLLRLFQPGRATAGLFAVVTSGLGRSGVGRVVAVVGAVLRSFVVAAIAGALPGVAVLVLGLVGSGAARVTSVVAGVVLIVVGALTGSVVGVVRRVGALPDLGFGLCSGMPGTRALRKAAALTPWLHGLVQQLAGQGPDEPPLTFGALAAAGCDLRMMTTNLTRRQPVAMPWTQRSWCFDPQVFRTLFPADVVDWMIEHPPALIGSDAQRWRSEVVRRQALPLRPFPEPADLPVIVATRMSLSFPFLISAVPLHAVDYALEENREARSALDELCSVEPRTSVDDAAKRLPKPAFDVNWFSDGGICSNLPVHFFDRPLPRRPTFAIDLAPFPPGHAKSRDESENSSLPLLNQAGALRRWTRWNTSGLAAVGDFGNAILATARSWVDESLIVMPGYRDRVVTVWHDDTEGGLNLSMPKEIVDDLSARGQCAAAKLVARFAGDQPGIVAAEGWRNQQWIRFRSATRGLDDWIAGFSETFTDPTGPAPYTELAGDAAHGPLPSYPLTVSRRRAVNERTDALLGLAAQWATPPDDAFEYNAPAPAPSLGLIPSDRVDRPRLGAGGEPAIAGERAEPRRTPD
jgi:hypothetical protein